MEQLIRDQKDFVYETTLGEHQPLDLMRRATEAGYEVGLVFVVLASVDLNIERVARGGHDIPEQVIRRRYNGSLRRLAQALQLAHATVIPLAIALTATARPAVGWRGGGVLHRS